MSTESKKSYPDTTLADAMRELGAMPRLMWEMRGPPNTMVAWLSCYLVSGSLVIVQTFADGNGWTSLVQEGGDGGDDEDFAQAVLDRCGVGPMLAGKDIADLEIPF